MQNNFTRHKFKIEFNIENLITLFYMEFTKEFHYEGEQHDFWEMVYIDKGEMVCTAGENRFTLKSGELVFHKPNEYHNLEGNLKTSPNASIVTFDCHDEAMSFFEGKIFRLTSDERTLLSQLFEEGLSCYQMKKQNDPLVQEMNNLGNTPFGASQAIKNLLELFLIKLYRNGFTTTKTERRNYVIDGIDVPYGIKKILDYMTENVTGRITVKDIAHYVNQSESQTKKIFSKYYNTGLIQHYNSLKIKEARRLLREGQMNIAQISEYLHFENPQYFSKCFKKFSHMTPSEYKKSIIHNSDD